MLPALPSLLRTIDSVPERSSGDGVHAVPGCASLSVAV